MENNYGSFDGPTTIKDSDGHERYVPRRWNSKNAFKYESSDLEEIFADVHPGNCALTEDMKKYNPPEELI
jgi:hypothetical protein